jgi:uncharacterized membrane protein YedE/YeeE
MDLQQKAPQEYWHPLVSGLALGVVLLATFVITGHGLGATGFVTRFTAWLGMVVVPTMTQANDYLGGLVEDGQPLNSWITWQVIGLAVGALVSAFMAGRIRVGIDGRKNLGGSLRLWTALVGGVAAGFGARVSAGCTSGLGLSGAATLSLAGFTFMAAFFAAGVVVSYFARRGQS